jgi:hypothetical protein
LALHLPPGFGGRNLPLPRATIEAFTSIGPIFSRLPFTKREKADAILHRMAKCSPPFEKGGWEGFLARDFQMASLRAEVRLKR